jgi:hypothetical protein
LRQAPGRIFSFDFVDRDVDVVPRQLRRILRCQQSLGFAE